MRGSDGVAETPKPGDARLLNSKALVIGNNRLAAQEALRNLEHAGYMGRVHTLSLVGDVEEAAMQVVETLALSLLLSTPMPTMPPTRPINADVSF